MQGKDISKTKSHELFSALLYVLTSTQIKCMKKTLTDEKKLTTIGKITRDIHTHQKVEVRYFINVSIKLND
jgi:hypothetical protein